MFFADLLSLHLIISFILFCYRGGAPLLDSPTFRTVQGNRSRNSNCRTLHLAILIIAYRVYSVRKIN